MRASRKAEEDRRRVIRGLGSVNRNDLLYAYAISVNNTRAIIATAFGGRTSRIYIHTRRNARRRWHRNLVVIGNSIQPWQRLADARQTTRVDNNGRDRPRGQITPPSFATDRWNFPVYVQFTIGRVKWMVVTWKRDSPVRETWDQRGRARSRGIFLPVRGEKVIKKLWNFTKTQSKIVNLKFCDISIFIFYFCNISM